MISKHNKYIILSLLLVPFLGCEALEELWYGTLEIDEDELYGRYHAGFGDAKADYIDLLEDSLFVYYYVNDNGQIYVDTGRWWFLRLDR